MHICQWNNKYWIWGRSETKALMERCALWAQCFWLISPKWLTFQAKDMHIREWNKVLGKSAIKRGVIFQDPLSLPENPDVIPSKCYSLRTYLLSEIYFRWNHIKIIFFFISKLGNINYSISYATIIQLLNTFYSKL